MSCTSTLFLCKLCGNLAKLIIKTGVPLVCCGEKMAELVPNTVDASLEKHKPVVTVSGETISVAVGSVLHPMQADHNISFVCVETDRGCLHKCLNVGEEPNLTFNASKDKPIAVFAYCNLHGLWKTDI